MTSSELVARIVSGARAGSGAESSHKTVLVNAGGGDSTLRIVIQGGLEELERLESLLLDERAGTLCYELKRMGASSKGIVLEDQRVVNERQRPCEQIKGGMKPW